MARTVATPDDLVRVMKRIMTGINLNAPVDEDDDDTLYIDFTLHYVDKPGRPACVEADVFCGKGYRLTLSRRNNARSPEK